MVVILEKAYNSIRFVSPSRQWAEAWIKNQPRPSDYYLVHAEVLTPGQLFEEN